jgi:hypothetical protein
MDSALINIVRKSLASASTEHDYTAGELFTRHDEIALVDPMGDPCAVPTQLQDDAIDYAYDYASGGHGVAVRGSRLSVGLSIDYIDNVVARRLQQWKKERALVYVSPNMGRNTLFSWRAFDMKATLFNGGGLAKDLTGNFSLSATFGAHLRYWDTGRRQFIQKTTSNRTPLMTTPGGAGLVTYQTVVNRMNPTYPKSATLSSAPTASGWVGGGADSADISAALVAGGFGHIECTDSLRVTVAGRVTSDRYLAVFDQFNSAHGNYGGYTFVNGYTVAVTVWLRGQLPYGASLVVAAMSTADTVTRSLSGQRFDGWTPVSINWTPSALTVSNLPYLALGLSDSIGAACEFEIGPVMVTQASSGYSLAAAAPVWTAQTTSGTLSGAAHVATTTSLRLPGQGTIACSYWAPNDTDASWRAGASNHILCGNSDISVRIGRTAPNEYFYVTGATNNSTYQSTPGAIVRPGQINTVAVTWDGAGVKLYVNGALVATDTTTLPALSGSNSAWKIGSSVTQYGCFPLAMLTCRIDEGAMTAAQITQLHNALVDPIALGLAIAARGRTFRVVGVPGTLRPSAGGSQVLGMLELEQADFDQFTADPFLMEKSIV